MALSKIPSHTELSDGQFIQINGPNGIIIGYHYDEQSRALYFKESQVIYPNFHGASHIAEDPIPSATCETPGLMSSDDKCKLDALIQTRLGVLGFQGAGFPNDGGWMTGDIILAAGTEFISIERIGNVVRFNVDSPIPLNCSCEECVQIFWVQDSTDVSAIRPPTCNGKLPGANVYGEMKIYLFPESTIVDPNNVDATLNNKGNYPSLVFKRYDDSIVPGSAELELVLKRDTTNNTTTEIGWSFTPGASGKVENVWFVGKDTDGNLLSFKMEPETEPGAIGALLYNGHVITKKMGVITDYTSTVLSTNQYTVRFWNVDDAKAIGDAFVAQNVWHYQNPENPPSGDNAQKLTLDATVDLLSIGTLVDLWGFKVGEVAGEPIMRWYFNSRPHLNPNNLWNWVGLQRFGDTLTARKERQPSGTDDITTELVSDVRLFERTIWGITGFYDPLLAFDIAATAGTEGADLNQQHRAYIDTTLPGLVVNPSAKTGVFSERPVILWNRHNLCNALLRLDIGMPQSSDFSPYDVIIRSPIDSYSNIYMKVVETGMIADLHYIRVSGVKFHEMPPFGTVRIISPTNNDMIFDYDWKFAFPTNSSADIDTVVLAGTTPYVGAVGDILELLHQEYNSTIVRVEFTRDTSLDTVSVQFKVGTLDMSLPYENEVSDDVDDFVRGLAGGYAVSAIYTQNGTFSGVGNQPTSSLDGFVVYTGGLQSDGAEYWNNLEIMVRNSQVWIWWNKLLIPPSSTLSAALPTPVSIDTPYFPITYNDDCMFGKYGIRMWPGASIRRFEIRGQASNFSEFQYGQLSVE